MKKFSCNKIKYFPADSVEGAKIINKNLSKEFGFKIAIDWSKCKKGGHTHNHIYNVCSRILFRSKNVRQIDPTQKQKFREVFEMQVFGGMNPWQRLDFLDILKKGKSARITKKRRREMCELKMSNNPCKYCNGEIDEGKPLCGDLVNLGDTTRASTSRAR